MEWAHRYDHYMKTEKGYIHYELMLALIGIVGLLAWIVISQLKKVIFRD